MSTIRITMCYNKAVICLFLTLFQESLSGTVTISRKGIIPVVGENGTQIVCECVEGPGETINQIEILAILNGTTNFQPILRFDQSGNFIFINDEENRQERMLAFNRIMPDKTAIAEFKSVQCIDETDYICRATFASSMSTTADSDIFSFTTHVPNSIPQSLKLQDAEVHNITEGMNLTFICNGNVGHPPGTFRWLKILNDVESEMVTTDEDILAMSCAIPPDGHSNLTFQASRRDNGAIIRCEIRHPLAPDNSFIDIQLTVFYHIDEISITVSPNKTFYDQHTPRIDLDCLTDGNPSAQYSWYKDQDFNISIGSDSTFKIQHVSVGMNGSYACVAQNEVNGEEVTLTTEIILNIGYTEPLQSEKTFIETTAGIAVVSIVVTLGTLGISAAAFKFLKPRIKIGYQENKILETPDQKSESQNAETDEGIQIDLGEQFEQNVPPVHNSMAS